MHGRPYGEGCAWRPQGGEVGVWVPAWGGVTVWAPAGGWGVGGFERPQGGGGGGHGRPQIVS